MDEVRTSSYFFLKTTILFLLLTFTFFPQEKEMKSFCEKFISTLNHEPELLYNFLPTLKDLNEIFPAIYDSSINDSLLSKFFIRKENLEIKLDQFYTLRSMFDSLKLIQTGDVIFNAVDEETENIFFLEIPVSFDTIHVWFSLSVIKQESKILMLEILYLKTNLYKKSFEQEFEEDEIEGELISPEVEGELIFPPPPVDPSTPIKNSSSNLLNKENEKPDSVARTSIAGESNQTSKESEAFSDRSNLLNEVLPAHSNFITLYKRLKK